MTGGIPLWGSDLSRPMAHEPRATTPRYADRSCGCDGDQFLGGRDPALGSSDRALRTASTQIRRTDPAKLRYPAGRCAALGAGVASGVSDVVGGELVTAASSRSSGCRERPTPIIAMTNDLMMPDRSSSAC